MTQEIRHREAQAAHAGPGRRSRLAILTAAAAAGVLAVGVPITIQVAFTTGEPADRRVPDSTDSPRPTDLKLPHVYKKILHVGEVETSIDAGQVLIGGESVLVSDFFWTEGAGDQSSSYLLRGDDLVKLPMLNNAVVILSHRGDRVATASYPTPNLTRISLHRLPAGAEERHFDLPIPGSCCLERRIDLLGFDAAGRVFFNVDGESRMWNSSGQVVPVTGTPGLVVQVGPAGVVAVPGEYGKVAGRVIGDVTESGIFRERLTLPTAEPTEGISWSASGTHVAYTAESGPVIDSLTDAAGGVRLDLGDRGFSNFVGFESETTAVLLAKRGHQIDILRCDTTSECQLVQEIGGLNYLDYWVFPHS